MGWLNRQLLTVLAAVALPVVMLVAFLFYTTINTERLALERLTRDRAEQISALLDVTLRGDVRLAQSLGSATSIAHGDLHAAYLRAQEFKAISPMWRTVRLSAPTQGVELFDLRRPIGAPPRPISPAVADFVRAGGHSVQIGGIAPDRDGGYGIPLEVPISQDGALRYVLTVVLDPDAVQRLVDRRFPDHSVGAVVDRSGRFIVRSVDYQNRKGQLGSTWLRAALRKAPQGSYRGITLEGLRNYTTYAPVPLTGWTTHVAIDASLIDGPRHWSMAVWGVVILISLALWAALIASGLRDHAQRRAQEERARQAQKMEAVGHLTGGIAHDFNNLLTAVIGGLDLALRRSDPAEPSRRYVEGSLDAARRGVALTSKLLAFSRVQKLQSAPVDLPVLIDEMRTLLEQSLGPATRLEVALAPDARGVETDANQLELALLNIALNARDAMPEGGVFRITSQVAEPRPSRPGAWIEIALADTGTGMSKAVAQRALEPFFTTKGVDKGTGLGLAQVYALARQAGGEVSLDSAPGRGTTVRLELPAAKLAPSPATGPDLERPVPTRSADATVLVVDDDDAVREVMVHGLRTRGYTVVEASNGAAALELLAHLAPDLLIVDFLMPGMNGAELAAAARQRRPGQPVLIVSGHMDSDAIARLVPDSPILRKPFNTDALWATVDGLVTAGPERV